jgi:radical SAM protein with 4Fe4S-binding SPASM domain
MLETKLESPILHSLPQNVDIVLTTKCNLACVFCKLYPVSGAKQVSIENFRKAAEQLFPTARLVSICSGGEPYLHKNLEELLRIIRQYSVPTWVLSNGMLLEEERIRTIVREELITLHGFSIDGIRSSTVEAIRVNAKLDVIVENIKMLIRIRKEERKHKPPIVIRYVLMRSNIEELPDAVRHWGEMGIDVIDCNYLSLSRNIDRQQSLYFHQDLTEEVFSEAQLVAEHYPRLTLNLPDPIHKQQHFEKKPKKCGSAWNFVFVNTDGEIFPCYCLLGIRSMGNIYEGDGDSFKGIWNNSEYQQLRRTTNDDHVKKYFSYCSLCETRFGWGDLKVHLGDQTWLHHLDLEDKQEMELIAKRHRKPKAR